MRGGFVAVMAIVSVVVGGGLVVVRRAVGAVDVVGVVPGLGGGAGRGGDGWRGDGVGHFFYLFRAAVIGKVKYDGL